jgi:hypothetical protein
MFCPSCSHENPQDAGSVASAGKCDEARQMLGEIHGWFTEGFDTADLKEAKSAHPRDLTQPCLRCIDVHGMYLVVETPWP